MNQFDELYWRIEEGEREGYTYAYLLAESSDADREAFAAVSQIAAGGYLICVSGKPLTNLSEYRIEIVAPIGLLAAMRLAEREMHYINNGELIHGWQLDLSAANALPGMMFGLQRITTPPADGEPVVTGCPALVHRRGPESWGSVVQTDDTQNPFELLRWELSGEGERRGHNLVDPDYIPCYPSLRLALESLDRWVNGESLGSVGRQVFYRQVGTKENERHLKTKATVAE